MFKAVDGDGKIVGGVVWEFVTGREGKEKEEGNGEGDGKGDGKEKEWNQEDWGETANRAFCEDIFIKGDEIMLKSTKGKDYASKSPSTLSPFPSSISHQQKH